MTDQEWLQCDDPEPMIEFLLKKRDRKMRLAAVAACRLFADRLSDERSREALDVAERFADDQATDTEREGAWKNADSVTRACLDAYGVAAAAPGPISEEDEEIREALNVAWAAEAAVSGEPEEAFSQLSGFPGYEFLIANVLRDVFGPMTRVSFNPAWLSPAVTALADSIYDGRHFDQLPRLG